MKFLSKLDIWDKISLVSTPGLVFFAMKGDLIATLLASFSILVFNDFALIKLIRRKFNS